MTEATTTLTRAAVRTYGRELHMTRVHCTKVAVSASAAYLVYTFTCGSKSSSAELPFRRK